MYSFWFSVGQAAALCTHPNMREKIILYLDKSVLQANENLYPCLAQMVDQVLRLPKGTILIQMTEFQPGKN